MKYRNRSFRLRTGRHPLQKKHMAALVMTAVLLLTSLFALPAPLQAGTLEDHAISFDRIVNARDLGGYPTKNGRHVKKKMLLRTAELAYASAADRKKLRKEYHLGTVIDFRYGTDFRYCPDRRIKGVTYRNIPARYRSHADKRTPKKRYQRLKKKSDKAFRTSFLSSAGRAKASYFETLVMSSYSQKSYRKFFRYLLKNDPDEAILFHCVHGKDRTGVAAFMTLIALGVDEKTAYRDFTLTNTYLKTHVPKAYADGKRGVREKNLRRAVNKAKKKYGSLNRFLEKAYGLNKAKRQKLRRIYTK